MRFNYYSNENRLLHSRLMFYCSERFSLYLKPYSFFFLVRFLSSSVLALPRPCALLVTGQFFIAYLQSYSVSFQLLQLTFIFISFAHFDTLWYHVCSFHCLPLHVHVAH